MDQRNLLLAIVLSVGILIGFQYLFEKIRPPAPPPTPAVPTQTTPAAPGTTIPGTAPPGPKVPGPETPWTASGGPLTPNAPLTLTWDNGGGLVFSRTISVDENYMFTVRDAVRNSGTAPVNLLPYALISRTGTPQVGGYYILHEGLIGELGGSLREVKYS